MDPAKARISPAAQAEMGMVGVSDSSIIELAAKAGATQCVKLLYVFYGQKLHAGVFRGALRGRHELLTRSIWNELDATARDEQNVISYLKVATEAQNRHGYKFILEVANEMGFDIAEFLPWLIQRRDAVGIVHLVDVLDALGARSPAFARAAATWPTLIKSADLMRCDTWAVAVLSCDDATVDYLAERAPPGPPEYVRYTLALRHEGLIGAKDELIAHLAEVERSGAPSDMRWRPLVARAKIGLRAGEIGSDTMAALLAAAAAEAETGYLGGPIEVAARAGSPLRLQTLLKSGMKLSGGSRAQMRLSRSQGALQLFQKPGLLARGDAGPSPLHSAARGGHESCVQLLLLGGADPNATNADGRTALHESAAHGHHDASLRLIWAGADPNAKDRRASTALHLAAAGGHADVVTLLIESGANPLELNGCGETALLASCRSGHAGVVDVLTDSGVPADERPANGRTALHEAGSAGVIDVLLNKGAKFDALDSMGRSPLHAASQRGDPDSVELLLAVGADPNAKDVRGRTPLDEASEGLSLNRGIPTYRRAKHGEVVQILIMAGAVASAPMAVPRERQLSAGRRAIVKPYVRGGSLRVQVDDY
jgi:ankyrin repeat protein